MGRRRTVVDEGPAKSLTPRVRLDEQGIQIRVPILTVEYCRETLDRASRFENKDKAGVDLLDGEIDCIGVRQQRLAVAGVTERCPPLQCLERTSFRRESRTDQNVIVHAVPQGGVRSSVSHRPQRVPDHLRGRLHAVLAGSSAQNDIDAMKEQRTRLRPQAADPLGEE